MMYMCKCEDSYAGTALFHTFGLKASGPGIFPLHICTCVYVCLYIYTHIFTGSKKHI